MSIDRSLLVELSMITSLHMQLLCLSMRKLPLLSLVYRRQLATLGLQVDPFQSIVDGASPLTDVSRIDVLCPWPPFLAIKRSSFQPEVPYPDLYQNLSQSTLSPILVDVDRDDSSPAASISRSTWAAATVSDVACWGKLKLSLPAKTKTSNRYKGASRAGLLNRIKTSYLLNWGDGLISSTKKEGITALHMAAREGDVETCRWVYTYIM
jgi:hypothetical protein